MANQKTTREILEAAKRAAPVLAAADTGMKNRALTLMATSLIKQTDVILAANEKDLEAAKGTISEVMLDRLALTMARIDSMAAGIIDVMRLPDPAWQVLERIERPNGLVIEKTAVPIGVIAIIYESRPNVTADAAALALKSGNGCVLRVGKEAWRSAAAITAALQDGIAAAGLPREVVQLVEDTSRGSAAELMAAVGYVDLLIPRGGAGLIRACTENAKVPCIETGTGICHLYVDESADLDMALDIVENAKASRPSVCNAAEVLLVHRGVAEDFLPRLAARLGMDRRRRDETPVVLRADERASAVLSGVSGPAGSTDSNGTARAAGSTDSNGTAGTVGANGSVSSVSSAGSNGIVGSADLADDEDGGVISWAPAGDADFDTEFLDYILGVKVVDSVEEAIAHIAAHSTGHSEAIITKNVQNAEKFTRLVDSAAVYVNASTRFTDGGEFGLGCEMGISTQKLHARGPMGLKELTTYKYIVRGTGQIR